MRRKGVNMKRKSFALDGIIRTLTSNFVVIGLSGTVQKLTYSRNNVDVTENHAKT